jgi:hypothetical protein
VPRSTRLRSLDDRQAPARRLKDAAVNEQARSQVWAAPSKKISGVNRLTHDADDIRRYKRISGYRPDRVVREKSTFGENRNGSAGDSHK